MLDVLSEDGKNGALYELLYADELEGSLRRERIEG